MIRKVLWGIIILAILVSFPSFLERIKVENSNKAYEIAVPYEQVKQVIMLREGIGISKEETLAELKNFGVHSLGIEPISIEKMEEMDIIRTITKDILLLDYGIDEKEIPTIAGLYFEVIDPNHPYIDQFLDALQLEYELEKKSLMDEGYSFADDLDVQKLKVNNRTIYFLPNATKATMTLPLGYNMDDVYDIIDAGLSVIPRISNEMSFIDYEDHFIYQQLEELASLGADKILFTGNEVVGYEKTPEELEQFTDKIKQFGFNIGNIEFADQKGMGQLLVKGDLKEDVIRTLSLSIGKNSKEYEEEVNKAIRAVKERNIRLLYVNLLKPEETYLNIFEANEGMEKLQTIVSSIINKMPSDFQMKNSRTFDHFEHNVFVRIAILIASVAFIALFTHLVLPKWTIVVTAFMVLVAVFQLVTGHSLALKAITLAVAVVGAMYAVFSVKEINNWKKLFFQFITSLFIASVASWLVIQLLYGTQFVVKTDQFSGVKVLAGLPLLAGLIILYRKQLRDFAIMPVRYWHLLVFAIFGAIFIYYVSRTGNDAVVLSAELQFRQWLEDTLYVRPRTTQFLVGFPLFLLGLYLVMKKKHYATLFLAIGFVAFSSMIGTFTHLHTPILISILRTIHGIWIGTVVGIVYIVIYNIFMNRIFPWLKMRWG